MKKTSNSKSILTFFLIFTLTAILFTGCGRNNQNRPDETGGNEASTAQSEGSTVAPGQSGNQNGQNSTDNGTGNDSGNGTGMNGNTGTDNSLGNDLGNAADDLADGVGNAVDDLAGVDFNDYNSAGEYLMGQIGTTQKEGRYEIRNEDRTLKNYDSSDASKKGYRYEIYDSQKGKSHGVFYVDSETGKIYQETGKDKTIKEYKSK